MDGVLIRTTLLATTAYVCTPVLIVKNTEHFEVDDQVETKA